ncbi:unnamed protein product [Peniophora sp. CBMAI 1063]|nr:unnamed protein product [Peniophora sp. CBMAI 1063]
MVLLTAIAASSFIFYADPKGTLDIKSFKVINTHTPRIRYTKLDQGRVNFNTEADLRPLFNWNTKQLFVWMQAEYTNSRGVQNEVVMWDRIVKRKEDALLDLRGRNKYYWHDLVRSFNGSEPVTFSLKYNIMPYVGLLTMGEAARTTEPLPFPPAQAPTD